MLTWMRSKKAQELIQRSLPNNSKWLSNEVHKTWEWLGVQVNGWLRRSVSMPWSIYDLAVDTFVAEPFEQMN